jgi:cytochrome b pre-mRNA-processing protein 3
MLWLFKRPATTPGSPPATIDAIYGMIVAQARLPVFYRDYGVPDTVNGRFDMIVLHLWMVLRRFRAVGVEDVPQALMDRFCSDLDGNLREMGVSDLTVPKKMLGFAGAFYGRSAAYDAAFAAGNDQLADALARNVLVSEDAARAAPLAAYVRQAVGALDTVDEATLRSAAWSFAAPGARPADAEAAS